MRVHVLLSLWDAHGWLHLSRKHSEIRPFAPWLLSWTSGSVSSVALIRGSGLGDWAQDFVKTETGSSERSSGGRRRGVSLGF
jgi:hypothetical protein